MKKLNEAQMIIFEEESARAIMLKKAKESLNEAEYQGLVALLPEYESRAELSEVSRIDLYELIYEEAEKAKDPAKQGIFGSVLQGLRGKAQNFRDRNMSAEQIRAELRRILEDEATKKLFATLEGYKEKTADELANDPNYQGMKRNVDAFVLRTNMLYNQLASLEPGTKAINNAETLVKVAETLGMDPKDLLAGYRAIGGDPSGGNQSRQTKAGVSAAKVDPNDDISDIMGTVTGKLDPDGDGKVSPEEKKAADKDGDGDMDAKDIISLLISLGIKDRDIMIQIINKLGLDPKGKDPEDADPDGEGEGGKEQPQARTNRVAKLQDQVILALSKVMADKDIKLGNQDQMELAKTLTNNIVDQLRANGVKFKGLDEAVYNAVHMRLLKEDEELAKARRAAAEKKEAEMNPEEGVGRLPQKLLKLVLNKKKEFSANEVTFIKSLRSIQSTYRSRNYKSQSGLGDALRDDEGFLDIYETYIDILAIDRAFTALKKKLKGDEEKLEKFVNKVKQKQLPLGRIDKKTGKEATMKLNSITAMKGRFVNDYSALNPRGKPASHPKELERYRELKMKATRMQKGSKDAKDMYEPEKVPDAKLPQGKKGQVNIKNLIFQAFKGLNLDKDVMKDLEQSLNKRLQGIAKQYIAKGMDVRVLEEKLTRYANSVAKQLNEGR